MKTAPINNLDPERSVGYINYELKQRGAKQLSAASSALVKARGRDLIEGEDMDRSFVKLASKDGEIEKVIKKWKDSQEQGLD